MEVNIIQMKIKNRPDYLFNDNLIVDINDFDSSLLEINKLSFKGVFSLIIYYIKYIPRKSPNRVSIDRTNSDENYLYLFHDDVDGYIEENDGIKYLVFASTEKNKEALKNYTKLWEETKIQIKVINDDEPIKYRKGFMKIRFESEDDLPFGKTFNILNMIIVVASVLKKWYHYWYFKDGGFTFESHVCNKCHNVLMTAYELKNIGILNVKGVDFGCILLGISRDKAVNRLNNSVLEDKVVL